MAGTELYLQSIFKRYPDLIINSMKINGIGQNNDIVEINDEFIFRFPKYQIGIQQLEMETRVLELIRKYISLSIPFPEYMNFENKVVGEVFVGYKRIQGEPFWVHSFKAISNFSDIKFLAEQLANFLMELHSIPIGIVDTSMSSVVDLSHWEKLYERIKLNLFTHINSQEVIDRHFEMFLNQYSKTKIEATLVHGDFGTSNILFDPTVPTITGIIDFGEAHIGDPAIDIAGILGQYGEEFLELFRDSDPAPYW